MQLVKQTMLLALGVALAFLGACATPIPRHFTVFFDERTTTFDRSAEGRLAEAAQVANVLDASKIIVKGHTDTQDTPENSLDLSVRRAEAVKRELVKLKVRPEIIRTEGRGDKDLSVRTRDGIREPRNNRATIDIP